LWGKKDVTQLFEGGKKRNWEGRGRKKRLKREGEPIDIKRGYFLPRRILKGPRGGDVSSHAESREY